MPLPQRVVGPDGQTLFTEQEVTAGQQMFLRRGLQQYGSVMGHGGYLGPDYTAEYLRLSADRRRPGSCATPGIAGPDRRRRQMTAGPTATTRPAAHWQFTAEQVSAFEQRPRLLRRLLRHRLHEQRPDPTGRSPTQQEIHELTAFFAWTAWAAAAERAGTRLLLHQQLAARSRGSTTAPTGRHRGLVGAVAHRTARPALGVHVRGIRPLEPEDRLAQRRGADAVLPTARRGGAHAAPSSAHHLVLRRSCRCCSWPRRCWAPPCEHYRADLTSFFGFDLAQILPYNLARTWHVQLALFWTAAAFLAGGIFLAPIIARP